MEVFNIDEALQKEIQQNLTAKMHTDALFRNDCQETFILKWEKAMKIVSNTNETEYPKNISNNPQKLYITGDKDVSEFSEDAANELDAVIEGGVEVLVGDNTVIDVAIQNYLARKKYPNVTVYCSGEHPQNYLCTEWKVRSCYAFSKYLKGRMFKSVENNEMIKDCSQALLIGEGNDIDINKTIRRLERQKKRYHTVQGFATYKGNETRLKDLKEHMLKSCGKYRDTLDFCP